MVRRTSLLIVELLAMLMAGLVVLGGVSAWRLQAGPIDVEDLTPYLEEALSADDGRFSVEIEKTVVVWAGWRDAIDIRAIGLSVIDAEGLTLAQIPELSVAISVKALIDGRLEPSSLDAIRPSVRIIRAETGGISFGFFAAEESTEVPGDAAGETAQGDSRNVAGFLIDELLAEPDPEREFGFLHRVSLIGARVVFEDRVAGGYYRASDTNLELRRGGGGITGGAGMVLDYSGRKANLTIDVAIASASRRYEVDFAFQQVEPAAFAASIPQLAELSVAKMPLNGEIALRGQLGGRVDEIGFDFVGGSGFLDLNQLYREPVVVDSLRLTGAVTDDLQALKIEQAIVSLGDATIYAEADIAPDGAGREIALKARVENLPVRELHRYWPAWTHPGSHEWVADNITTGTIDEAHVALGLRIGGEGEPRATLGQLEGGFAFTGLNVHYKRPMTPVVGGNGTATFDRHGFVFNVEGGATLAEKLVLEGSTVRIENIDIKNEARLIVDGRAGGPLVTALAVLDEEPLRYGDKMGFDPDTMAGTGAADLHFELPLVRNITGDMLEVEVKSRLEDVSAPGPLDLKVTEGALDLQVDRAAMRIEGDVKLNGVPAALIWDENFQNVEKFRRRFEVKGRTTDAQRRALGLPDLTYWLQGPVDADLVYTIREKKNDRLSVRGDITAALAKVEEADWRKEPGEPGSGAITGYVTRKGGLVFDSFKVQTGDTEAELAMEFPPGFEDVSKITIKKALYRGNDVSGTVTPRKEGGYRVSVSGHRMDVRYYLDTATGPAENGVAADEEIEPFTLIAGFDEAITGPDLRMHNATFTGKYDGRNWESVILNSKLNEGAELKLSYGKGEEGYELLVKSEDAGQALRTLDWWSEIQGGSMAVDGLRQTVGGPLKGKFEVYNFKMTEAPAGIKLLQAITIIGLPSAAEEGTSFRGLEGTYTYDKGVLTFGDVEAWGAVGIKVDKGSWINFNTQTVHATGVVIPANTVQKILSYIPLLGQILGEGLIAVNFDITGPIDNPKVDPKEGTAFVPGLLRKLIRKGGDKEVDEESLPGATPPRRDD